MPGEAVHGRCGPDVGGTELYAGCGAPRYGMCGLSIIGTSRPGSAARSAGPLDADGEPNRIDDQRVSDAYRPPASSATINRMYTTRLMWRSPNVFRVP